MKLGQTKRIKAGKIVYQPIINVINKNETGLESLFRIKDSTIDTAHPSTGYLLKKYNRPRYASEFDYYCASLLLFALNKNHNFSQTFITLNVNHSSLLNKKTFKRILAINSKLKSIGKYLIVELIEHGLPNKDNCTLLHQLSLVGVKIAIDDFGTGYNTLIHVKDLTPIDIIKISFNFQTIDPVLFLIDQALTNFTNLSINNIIVEHIDNETKAFQISSLGVNLLQGHFFGKPTEQMILKE